jgi:hypothetical protein
MRHVRDVRGAGGLPIRVRLVDSLPDGSLADCGRRAGYFNIRIVRDVPDLMRWFLYLHEAAHAVAWDADAEIDHSDCGKAGCSHWGCAYARLWREHHHDADHWG